MIQGLEASGATDLARVDQTGGDQAPDAISCDAARTMFHRVLASTTTRAPVSSSTAQDKLLEAEEELEIAHQYTHQMTRTVARARPMR